MEKSTFSSPRRRRIPEHIRSVAMFSGAYPFTLPSMGVNRPFHSRIPEDIRSFSNHNALTAHVFRNISVHFSMVFRYPGRDILNSETTMAGSVSLSVSEASSLKPVYLRWRCKFNYYFSLFRYSIKKQYPVIVVIVAVEWAKVVGCRSTLSSLRWLA